MKSKKEIRVYSIPPDAANIPKQRVSRLYPITNHRRDMKDGVFKTGERIATYRPLGNRLDLAPHEPLQLVCTLRVRRRLGVVTPTVIKNELRIPNELHGSRVQVLA